MRGSALGQPLCATSDASVTIATFSVSVAMRDLEEARGPRTSCLRTSGSLVKLAACGCEGGGGGGRVGREWVGRRGQENEQQARPTLERRSNGWQRRHGAAAHLNTDEGPCEGRAETQKAGHRTTPMNTGLGGHGAHGCCHTGRQQLTGAGRPQIGGHAPELLGLLLGAGAGLGARRMGPGGHDVTAQCGGCSV